MSARFEVRQTATGRWSIYDLHTQTWADRSYRQRDRAQDYLTHLTHGRRDIIAAWIIGTIAPDELRPDSRGGYAWRRQHEGKPEPVA